MEDRPSGFPVEQRLAKGTCGVRIDRPHVAGPTAERRKVTPRRRQPATACYPAHPLLAPLAESLPGIGDREREDDGPDPEEILRYHAVDLAYHLADRLQEVERRELAAAEFESRLKEAEAAAQAWVAEQDFEFLARERELQRREEELRLRNDDTRTAAAAAAAAEISADEELSRRCEELDLRQQQLESRLRELHRLEERLGGKAIFAGDAACDSPLSLEVRRRELEAIRDHRLAVEQRWIAGQLWLKIVQSGVATRQELLAALDELREQLAELYARERQSLEQLLDQLGPQ
jgi:hypothetical protein